MFVLPFFGLNCIFFLSFAQGAICLERLHGSVVKLSKHEYYAKRIVMTSIHWSQEDL